MPDVVSCVLMNDKGEILILKRSDKVSTYKGCWSFVAGYVEEDEKPLDTAFKEICEEVKLGDSEVALVKEGDSVEFTDFYEGVRYDWRVFPFLFKVYKNGKIQIDWEHIDYRWIAPSDIGKFVVVPHLKEVVKRLLM